MRSLVRLLPIAMLLMSSTFAVAQSPTPPSPADELILTVWWSDGLYPLANDRALRLLEAQIQDFNSSNTAVEVVIRLKPQEGEGSILTALTAAQTVAPTAMPDLVLIPRRDLLTAAHSGLIQPLDNWIPDAITTDLLPNVLALGGVDDSFYGLPYAITLEHMVYATSAFEESPPTSFRTVLEAAMPFIFPGQPLPTHEVNDVVLGQYLAAGGRLVNEADQPVLDQEPLLEVLGFYSTGLEMGIFSSDLGTFNDPALYWERFMEGELALAVTTSTLYLQQSSPLEGVTAERIPSATGQGIIILDGWVWALTATDPTQQAATLQFIEWVMSAEPQADYTQALGVLPSRHRALRLWSESAYIGQVETWLNSSLILPLGERDNAAAEQLQTAFMAVLGGTPYEEAAKNAIAALTTSN